MRENDGMLHDVAWMLCLYLVATLLSCQRMTGCEFAKIIRRSLLFFTLDTLRLDRKTEVKLTDDDDEEDG